MRTFVTALTLAVANAQYALSDCEAFAAEFENTCSGSPPNAFSGPPSGWASTTVNCSITGSPASGQPTNFRRVADGQYSTSASHDYKMCVSCRDDSGTIKIKVQSNTYPSHCYGTSNIPNYPNESTVAWESVWNPNVTGYINPLYAASVFTTSAATTSTLCDINITQKDNMNASSSYQNNAGSIDTWAGIALDNVAIFNGLAAGNLDAVQTEADTLDMCLTHSSPQLVLHYHSLGVCVNNSVQTSNSSHRSTSTVPGLCDNSYNTCLAGAYNFAVAEAW